MEQESDIWVAAIPDLPPILQPYEKERRAQGIERYGAHCDSERDTLLDLLQKEMNSIAHVRRHALEQQMDTRERRWALAKLTSAILAAVGTAKEIARRSPAEP